MIGQKWSLKDLNQEEEKLIAVDAVSLTGTVWSKRDLYNFLTMRLQKHLPPYKECTMGKSRNVFAYLPSCLDFLRDVLSNKKKVFNNSEIIWLTVP